MDIGNDSLTEPQKLGALLIRNVPDILYVAIYELRGVRELVWSHAEDQEVPSHLDGFLARQIKATYKASPLGEGVDGIASVVVLGPEQVHIYRRVGAEHAVAVVSRNTSNIGLLKSVIEHATTGFDS